MDVKQFCSSFTCFAVKLQVFSATKAVDAVGKLQASGETMWGWLGQVALPD